MKALDIEGNSEELQPRLDEGFQFIGVGSNMIVVMKEAATSTSG